MDTQEFFNLLRRDAVSIFSEDTLLTRLRSGQKLRIKLGADPSRPDLHLGHAVVLRKLRLFQELGHEVVFVIGDFTGMIGDPTGRSKTRVPLTFEETRRNAESYFRQVTKILCPEKTVITYNSQWLSGMNFADVLALAGKYTLSRILERDDFKTRWAENQPIGMHELFYPLMQGYDSVALHADIEVGGTDQTFNLLVGRELQRDYGQEPQEVITFPLLVGLDGAEKMSKSLGNCICIDEPPEAMFEKCMKVPDTLLGDYFRLTTDVPGEVFGPLLDGDMRRAHFAYAQALTTLYHGPEAAAAAEARYCAVAAGEAPEDIPFLEVPADGLTLDTLVKEAGLASSLSDARRLIAGGGIRLEGEAVTDPRHMVGSGGAGATGCSGAVLSRGKNRFVRLLFR